jgi:methylglutaconyl-CoA hydratase
MKLFLTGERFDGQQAVDMGLAHIAVPEDQLISSVEEQIAMINLGGPIAVQECKKLARRVPLLSIEEGFKETAEWSARMFRSEEGAEGMASFREKRKPSWVEN